jgi:glycosyltransferase involved in cell wall biosynthesis
VKISVVIPLHNEQENLPLLHDQLCKALPPLGRPYEILLVDDGSTDSTPRLLRELAARDPRVKVVLFRRNYGQTAAMQAGLEMASGDVIITMDGDLQNDPADIGMMLEKIEEGYDLVHGWRKDRKDAWLNRRLPSQIANWIISRVSRFPIHDLGCTLKAIRREIAQDLELYGEMHRFIPILAHWRGARCVEVVTRHHPRKFGQTKYGISRTLRVLLDLVTVKFMLDYFASPMKLFGMFGLGSGAAAMAAALATLLMKLTVNFDMTGNPLLLVSAFCGLVSLQFFSLGLLGEVSARIYFSSGQKQHYTIREMLNLEPGGNRAAENWSTDKLQTQAKTLPGVRTQQKFGDAA